MMIDEEAFEVAFKYCTGFTVKSLRAFTEAYEQARSMGEPLSHPEGKCNGLSSPANTVLVKNLVDAMRRMKKGSDGMSMNAIAAFREALTEANAYLERQGKYGEGWQPIETAPRDGTLILVNNIEPYGYRTDEEPMGTARWGTHWIKSGAWMSNGCCDGVSNYNPTHWMPLPNPPTTSQQEARECEDGK